MVLASADFENDYHYRLDFDFDYHYRLSFLRMSFIIVLVLCVRIKISDRDLGIIGKFTK